MIVISIALLNPYDPPYEPLGHIALVVVGHTPIEGWPPPDCVPWVRAALVGRGMRASFCPSDGRPYMPKPIPGRVLLPALGVKLGNTVLRLGVPQNVSAEGMTGSGIVRCTTWLCSKDRHLALGCMSGLLKVGRIHLLLLVLVTPRYPLVWELHTPRLYWVHRKFLSPHESCSFQP
jgi:hypothetical protein